MIQTALDRLNLDSQGRFRFGAYPVFLVCLAFSLSSCAVTATRPQQEMSDAGAAIHAAKEIEADKLAPELFRKATETYQNAKREYRLKNFKEARELAIKARTYAEKSEFLSMQSGGVRQGPPPDPLENQPPPPDRSGEYEKQTGTPFNPNAAPASPTDTGASPGATPPAGAN